MRWRCAGAAANLRASTARNVKFPPTDFNRIGTTYTSECGTLVRIEIDRATGAVRIAKAYSVLECGRALVPEVVLGQAQGGFAMGVGYALLEIAAALRGRARQRAMEPRAISRCARLGPAAARSRDRDAAAGRCRTSRRKGMAEVVMIPVVPAILNAIFDATGHRFRSLPVTQAHAQGSAHVTTLARHHQWSRGYGPMDVRDELTMNDFLREYARA